jgi:small subunit ribosomal protein S9
LPQIFQFPYQVKVWVNGGGISSQKLAVLKALSIGLSRLHPNLKPELKTSYNWYDERQVERRKFGRHKARKGKQWGKR